MEEIDLTNIHSMDQLLELLAEQEPEVLEDKDHIPPIQVAPEFKEKLKNTLRTLPEYEERVQDMIEHEGCTREEAEEAVASMLWIGFNLTRCFEDSVHTVEQDYGRVRVMAVEAGVAAFTAFVLARAEMSAPGNGRLNMARALTLAIAGSVSGQFKDAEDGLR